MDGVCHRLRPTNGNNMYKVNTSQLTRGTRTEENAKMRACRYPLTIVIGKVTQQLLQFSVSAITGGVVWGLRSAVGGACSTPF